MSCFRGRDKMSREMHYIYKSQKDKSGSYLTLKLNCCPMVFLHCCTVLMPITHRSNQILNILIRFKFQNIFKSTDEIVYYAETTISKAFCKLISMKRDIYRYWYILSLYLLIYWIAFYLYIFSLHLNFNWRFNELVM